MEFYRRELGLGGLVMRLLGLVDCTRIFGLKSGTVLFQAMMEICARGANR